MTLTHAWALFDAVQRLPREKTRPVSFSLTEDGDILKERQTLCYYRSRTVKLGGTSIKLDGYLQTGDDISPSGHRVD